MATTTNYGWTTPDDTALVKDGASAIRTLGSSVDTTTKALNPSTTLGDIEYRSSTANTNTRLGIGSTGNVLTVAGGVPTWSAPASGGGMTLLSTTALTGSTVTISSIDQTYTNLLLILVNVALSAEGINLQLRMNGTTSTSYGGTTAATSGATSPTLIVANQATTFMTIGKLGSPTSSRATLGGLYNIPLYTAGYGKFLHGSFFAHDNDGIPYGGYANFNFNTTSAITSLTIFPASGTMSAGSALIYGVK